ncbi:hypothetical protein DIPPA_07623 [Diplonema papillatum]|nr:hypothetical protein DIPPA_07623 [Diplonema papillatum]
MERQVATVSEWFHELGIDYVGLSRLGEREVAALYQWACAERVREASDEALADRAAALQAEAQSLEDRLQRYWGIEPAGFPAVLELARAGAALGVTEVEPALLSGALVDLQHEIDVLEDKHCACCIDRAELQMRQRDVHSVLDTLSRVERNWSSYAAERIADAAGQEQKTAMHFEKVAEYKERLQRMDSTLSSIGLSDSLTHGSLTMAFDEYTRLNRSLQEYQKKIGRFKIPPDIAQARAKTAALRAENKRLQAALAGPRRH